MKKFGSTKDWLIFGLFFVVAVVIFNLQVDNHEEGGHSKVVTTISWITGIILAGKLSGALSAKVGIPPVVGMLTIGMVMGGIVPKSVLSNETIVTLAELGVIVLLFQAGLHSTVKEMRSGFKDSFMVASFGVIIPWALGVLASIAIFEVGGFSSVFNGETRSLPQHLFFAITMCATSVGITLGIFTALRKTGTREYKITSGAAVFDDVIVLALASAIKSAGMGGEISPGMIFGKFFVAAVFFGVVIQGGRLLSPVIASWFASLSKDYAQARFILLLVICFFTATLAEEFGISPILGAFAGGLFLEEVHFKSLSTGKEKTMEDLIEPIAFFLVPIFFVFTGMSMDVSVFADMKILTISLVIGALMIVGKVASGFFAKDANPWVIGLGMAPRGEVGLVLIVIGAQASLITLEQQAVALAVVIITTVVSPIALSRVMKKAYRE